MRRERQRAWRQWGFDRYMDAAYADFLKRNPILANVFAGMIGFPVSTLLVAVWLSVVRRLGGVATHARLQNGGPNFRSLSNAPGHGRNPDPAPPRTRPRQTRLATCAARRRPAMTARRGVDIVLLSSHDAGGRCVRQLPVDGDALDRPFGLILSYDADSSRPTFGPQPTNPDCGSGRRAGRGCGWRRVAWPAVGRSPAPVAGRRCRPRCRRGSGGTLRRLPERALRHRPGRSLGPGAGLPRHMFSARARSPVAPITAAYRFSAQASLPRLPIRRNVSRAVRSRSAAPGKSPVDCRTVPSQTWPLERAFFVLREVFGFGFPDIASSVGRSGAACRQLAVRARRHVDAGRPRFEADRREREKLAPPALQRAPGRRRRQAPGTSRR